MIYGEDGSLRREQIYTYEPYHVFSQYTVRTFEYGEETTRQVLVFTDRTNGVSQYFSNGTLIYTRPVRRVFEGNKLVCQIMLNEDGSTASEFYWERDDEGNILSYDVPYGENLRRVTIYTYERIG